MSFDQIREGCILLIDKPLHWTSFDVVNKIKYLFNKQVKIGHGGTLDPLATGLIIVCTGQCTKMTTEFQHDDKAYSGIITLGATTPSYDMETEINQTYDINNIDHESLFIAAQKMLGVQQQIPPVHSAVKIGGKPAYLKARANEDITITSRTIEIKKFEIINMALPNVSFYIECSKGTYIRSIAHDYGKILNNGAYLSSLRRHRSGGFDINAAWQMESLLDTLQDLASRVSL